MYVIEQEWERIIEYLRKEFEIQNVSFATWIRPLQIHKIIGQTVYLKVKSSAWADYLQARYSVPLRISIEEITGEVVDIEFVIDGEKIQYKKYEMNKGRRLGLNERYTFDSFVVGSNNNFAYSASYAVAKSPGDVYNPLFIYSPAGLGKTHLLHSIANYVANNKLRERIVYATSEMFTNELIETLRRGGGKTSMDRFREKYREADILLVDDIQFIIGKESTQEEFFHTFNDLYMAGKQIVISSDRPPKEMKTLEERLKGRFECGLIADIGAPEYETRMAILRRRIEQELWERYAISDEILQYIAMNIRMNVRELEGALTKVVAWCKLNQHKELIDITVAEEILKDFVSDSLEKKISEEMILEHVAEHYFVRVEDIKSKKRNAKIVIPRQVSMYLLRDLTDLTLEAIGMILGGRNYTTVKYGIEKVTNEMRSNKELETSIGVLKKILGK